MKNAVMSMALSEFLDIATKTPEERREMQESIIRLMEMKDEDIDFSDIPKITDFSRFRRAKPYFDAMREHNRRVNEERARRKAMNESKVPD